MNSIAKGIRQGVLVAVILGVFFICFTAVAHGVVSPTATGKVKALDGVNLRSTYSTEGRIISAIPYKGTVTIKKEQCTSSSSTAADTRWYYVSSSYGTGWVRADFITATYKSVEGKTKCLVNVRSGPGTSFSKASNALSKGKTVKVLMTSVPSSGNKTWYRIYYDGSYYRYVYAEYISIGSNQSNEPIDNSEFESELDVFPSSYHSYLKKLHEKYPSWHFKAKELPYTWKEGLNEQCYSYSANTIPSSFKDGYKAVGKGTYNFDKHTYIGLDGSGWVAASEKAVAYYMDPRNWLDEINVFMFESLSYDAETQTESMVKDILSETAIPVKYSASYMKAGKTYNISPVFLAAKSRIELGTSDYMISGTKFTYNGKVYQGLYNAYNIGASDSASGDAAKKGLVYAGSGSTYLRPWTSLDLAIRGGAKFIAEDFIGNNQHTLYYERFNVANGLSSIGSHQYMTNTFAPATQANITYWNYSDSGMLSIPYTFEIPVYKSMPSARATAPSSGNNNNFLDSIKIYSGTKQMSFTEEFNRFNDTYSLKSKTKNNELIVKTVTNADDATVMVTGNTALKPGKNKITVKVKSSSGLVRYYYIYVTRVESVGIPDIKVTSDPTTGKPLVTWNETENADEYCIYRATSKNGPYTLLKTVIGLKFRDDGAVVNKKYYYKVKAVGTTGVVGSGTSSVAARICDLPRPVVIAVNDEESGKVKLTWDAVDGAIKYEIYRASSKEGTYRKMYTQQETSYTNKASAVAGKTYYYKVKAIHSNSYANSADSKIVAKTCNLPKPVVTSGIDVESGKISLTWNAVEGAVKYEIYRSSDRNGSYSKMHTQKGTTYVNKASATPGKRYYYKVIAVHENLNANSAYSTPVYRICDLARPVVTVTNDVAGKVKLSWPAIEGALKYEIYRATSEKGTYTKMYTQKGNVYVNKASVVVGKKYYYKVKAIHENSYANSAYSVIVSGIATK